MEITRNKCRFSVYSRRLAVRTVTLELSLMTNSPTTTRSLSLVCQLVRITFAIVPHERPAFQLPSSAPNSYSHYPEESLISQSPQAYNLLFLLSSTRLESPFSYCCRLQLPCCHITQLTQQPSTSSTSSCLNPKFL